MSGDQKKILIIDDEPTLVLMITKRLESSGFQVISAGSGAEGLNKAREEKPDLILLDVMMPEMDGFEVLKTLRQTPETSEISVVIFTAGANPKWQEKAVTLKADDFVNKMMPFEDLLQKLRMLLYES